MKYQRRKPIQIEALTFDEFTAQLAGGTNLPDSTILAHPQMDGSLAVISSTQQDLVLSPSDMLIFEESGDLTVVSRAEFFAENEPAPAADFKKFIVE